MDKAQIAILFGQYLDDDNFTEFVKILKHNCLYLINDCSYTDRQVISDLYENNMKEGKIKFDKLVWGKSKVKQISNNEFDIHFSDFLMKNGLEHNYNCKQRIIINDNLEVEKIVHMELEGEKEKLQAYYDIVFPKT